MGAFTGDENGPPVNQPEEEKQDERGVPTDVEGVFAAEKIKHGGGEFPCFDVEESDFYQNMQHGRKRLRFKSGTPAAQYMSKTQYKIPFFIRTTAGDGKVYTRKVK